MEIFKTDGFRLFINSTWKSVVVLISEYLIRVFIRSIEKLFHTSSRNPKKRDINICNFLSHKVYNLFYGHHDYIGTIRIFYTEYCYSGRDW